MEDHQASSHGSFGDASAIEGIYIGHHLVVSRRIHGIFNAWPPSQRLFASWDVGRVYDLFVSWSEPLSFEQLQRKTAFLLVMATVHCLSELASLQCLPAFLIVDTSKARFFPSHLSKMDRHSFGLADYRLLSSYDDQFRHVFGRRSRSVSPASCGSSCRS